MEIRWVTVFLDNPESTAESFWLQVTGSTLSARRGPDGAFATLLPPRGDPYLRVQRVTDGPGGCHLDLHVDPVALADAGERAVALGAHERFREDGLIVLDSPGGFPFCLVRWDGEAIVPEPVQTGGLSRLDQLALDAPPDLFDAECDFWAALTGWEARTGSRPEFRALVRPEGIPVRLLFQRLDHAPAGRRVSGHVDFACDDRARLAERHVAAGARVVATFPNWTTMADPDGRPYCLTGRDPRTGQPVAGR